MSVTLRYDRDEFLSTSGLLKICCLLCCLIGVLCIVRSSIVDLTNARACCYYGFASYSFLGTLGTFLARVFHMWPQQLLGFKTLDLEYYMHSSMAVACFLGGGLVLTLDVPSYTAAAFFALLAFSCHACFAFSNFRRRLQRDVATQTQI